MNNSNTTYFTVMSLGGSMSDLMQNLLKQNKNLSHCLRVVPTHCGQRKISKVLDEIQKQSSSFIAIGFTGGVNSVVNIGDIIIPLKAYCIETKEESIPNKEIASNLITFSWSFPSCIHHGIVWTSQHVIHADSAEKDSLAKSNCLCVDMETYWLFSEAQKRSIQVAAVLIVSDHVFLQPLKSLCGCSNFLPQTAETIASVREALEAAATVLRVHKPKKIENNMDECVKKV